jgi:Zn-finger nucleic acid-binding protein
MAQCPQCADAPLVHTMLAENLAALSCGKCLGTLVSLVAYRAWREGTGRDRLPAAAPAVPDALDAADSVAAKKCPKCRSLMSKYRISAGKANRLDYCPHCDEVWLDDGEWQLVESLAQSGDFARVFTQAWQFAVRADVTSAMEEQRLRELLGGEYGRFREFARWLDAQPGKHEILARLGRLVGGSRPATENAAPKGRRP